MLRNNSLLVGGFFLLAALGAGCHGGNTPETPSKAPARAGGPEPSAEQAQACEPGDFKDCERQCSLGDAQSCVNLAVIYDSGLAGKNGDEPVVENESEAADLMLKACDLGSAHGCGYLMSQFQKAPRSPEKALGVVSAACDRTDLVSCYYLGRVLLHGLAGVPANADKGTQALRRACEGGIKDACAEAKPAAEATAAPDTTTDPSVPASPPGLIQLANPEAPGTSTTACGAYQIESTIGPGPKFISSVTVLDDKGKTLKKFTPKDPMDSVSAGWCFDVTGDGVPEMVVTERSMGAHCCYTHMLISLNQPNRPLLSYDAGNGSNYALNPVNIDGNGAYELVDTDDVLTIIGSAPYAGARFLPVVFAYQKGVYVRATRRFKSYVDKERTLALKDCQGDCWDDNGEYILGLSLIIGDWDSFKKEKKAPANVVAELEKFRIQLAPRLKY